MSALQAGVLKSPAFIWLSISFVLIVLFATAPLISALIGGGIAERPAFLEVYMENNLLFYRPIAADGEEKAAGLALTAV